MSGDNFNFYTPVENFNFNPTEGPEAPSVKEMGNLTDQVKLKHAIAANDQAIEATKAYFASMFSQLNGIQDDVVKGIPTAWLNNERDYPLYSHILKANAANLEGC
ncbi:MAG TPA: hypothetical protein V6C81_05520 [Planktothrix sp.]|jgi:hypothetical protein